VTSPLRAVLTAHLRASWNRTLRESQVTGAWSLVLVAGLLGLFAILPALGLAGVLGYGAGKYLGTHPAPLLILGTGLTLVPALLGLMEGILMAGRGLPWDAFRAFPLRFRTLVLAELATAAGSVIFLLAGSTALVFFLSLSVMRPALAPAALLWWAGGGLVHLLAVQVGSGVSSLLARKLRFAGFLVILLLSIAPALVMSTVERRAEVTARAQGAEGRAVRKARAEAMKKHFEDTMVRLGQVAVFLPGTQSVRGSLELVQGTVGPGLLRQLYPLACLGLLALAGARLLAAEERDQRRREVAPRSAKAARLWSFAQPSQGIARLMGTAILKSHVGRFTFVMPIFPLVLFAGPLQRLGEGSQALAIAVVYVLLATGSLVYNQFGLDRHGIKALFLLPVSGETLLQGKALALGLHGAALTVLTLALSLPFIRTSPLSVLSAFALGACLLVVNLAVGQWTSVWQPRALPWDSFNRTNLPFATAMVNLGVNAGAGGLFFGLNALLVWLVPGAAFPVMAALAAALWGFYLKVVLPALGVYVDRHRERMLHALEA